MFLTAKIKDFAVSTRISIFKHTTTMIEQLNSLICFILTEYGQGYRRVFDKELAKKSLDITPVLEIGRTDIITRLLAKSDMISFLPDFVTKDLVETGELCYLDVCDMETDIWKQLIYHKNKWMSKSLKTVIEYIKANEFSK